MFELEILDSTSDPGSPARANDDALGSNQQSAFVIDGATGLGEKQFMPGEGSDAAWLANYAADFLTQNLKHDSDIHTIILNCIVNAKTAFEMASRDELVERYAWPSASFVLANISGNNVIFSGLGDCTIYTGIGEKAEVFSPLAEYPSFESDWASRHIRKTGGFGSTTDLLSNPETLEDLRVVRALQNTRQSAVWTLGLEPAAAGHLVTEKMQVTNPTYCLLCSDGFSALVDTYDAYNPQTLLEAARTNGLDELMKQLRRIELEIDPDGFRYPRFKRSDDATALFVKIDR